MASAEAIEGVYIARRADGLHKIGYSTDVRGRFKFLSCQHPGVELVHVIESRDSFTVEQFLHAAFRSHRVGGEWFALVPEHVSDLKAIACCHSTAECPTWLHELHSLSSTLPPRSWGNSQLEEKPTQYTVKIDSEIDLRSR